MPIVRFLRKMPTDPVVPAPDREFADSLVPKLKVCAVMVFDASERPLELNYVREVFSAKESMVGSCAVFDIAAEPNNSSFEPRRTEFPSRLVAGSREVDR